MGRRQLLVNKPLGTRVSMVKDSENSEDGPIFKTVLTYESVLGGKRTTTRRFATIKEARHWAKKAMKPEKP